MSAPVLSSKTICNIAVFFRVLTCVVPGNPKIFKDTAPLRWSPGLLQMEVITEETIGRYCDEEVSDHLVQLAQYIGKN